MTLHKTITKFILKDVQNLLKEMKLIELKSKKEYAEDDIKNDEIDEKI